MKRVFLFPLLALLALMSPALAEPYRAVDGDTIALGTERFRILDLDTPESFRPQCRAEQMIAKKATERLQQLLDSGSPIEVQDSGRRDKYKRKLAKFLVGGQDVASILINEGLGMAYNGRVARLNWCAPLRPEAPRNLGPYEREERLPD